jgi:DNA-binding response OmpR family regulator
MNYMTAIKEDISRAEAPMYRIVIVEDDPLMQKMLAQALRAEGFECALCPDGAAALSRIPKERPDLVVLDVNLPDMTGHEICRALKSDARTKGIPVIMLTGEARSVDERVNGLDLGAEDYLFKPISPKVLIARIRAILSTSGKSRP